MKLRPTGFGDLQRRALERVEAENREAARLDGLIESYNTSSDPREFLALHRQIHRIIGERLARRGHPRFATNLRSKVTVVRPEGA